MSAHVTPRDASWPGTSGVVYVSGNGSDTSDGLSQRFAKKTLAAGIAALPSTGGHVVLDPHITDGIYDVGSGLVIDNDTKWYTITSPTGEVASRALAITGTTSPDPVIYSSTGGALDSLIKLSTASGVHNGNGFTAKGLCFDLRGDISYGIHAFGHGLGKVQNCRAIGPTTPSIAQYLLATQVDTHSNDCSWWRVLDNFTYHVGLHKAGFDANDIGANNQHVWRGNICLGGALTQAFLNIYGGTRCYSAGNNFEGSPTTAAIMMEQTRQSWFGPDGGETISTYIRSIGITNNNGNTYCPLGITAGQSGKILVNDDGAKRNRVLTDFIGWQVGYAEHVPVTGVKTSAYTITVWDKLIRCDSTAGDFNVTLPTANSAQGNVHIIKNFGSAGTVTVLTAGGTVDGASTASLTALQSGGYVSDGTNWYST